MSTRGEQLQLVELLAPLGEDDTGARVVLAPAVAAALVETGRAVIVGGEAEARAHFRRRRRPQEAQAGKPCRRGPRDERGAPAAACEPERVPAMEGPRR
jgi:hypothetical protein